MNLRELEALGMTLEMCVMFGDMEEAVALEELRDKVAYAKAVDEVSK